MPRGQKGRKHALLLYRRALDRLWMPLLPLALLLAAGLWFSGRYWPGIGYIPPVPDPLDSLLYMLIVIIVIFSGYSIVARSMAYVQARPDHLRVSSPLISFKISYRRIKRAGLSTINQIFPPGTAPRSIRSILEPYQGQTAVVLELKGYPVSPFLLRILLGRSMMLPDSEGLVLLVKDWMDLSTEIDSHQGSWMQAQNRPAREIDPSYGLLQNLRRK